MAVLVVSPFWATRVETALTQLEWSIARERRRARIQAEIESIEGALANPPAFLDVAATTQLRDALVAQLGVDVGEDEVSQHPLRTVPMDIIVLEVMRECGGALGTTPPSEIENRLMWTLQSLSTRNRLFQSTVILSDEFAQEV